MTDDQQPAHPAPRPPAGVSRRLLLGAAVTVALSATAGAGTAQAAPRTRTATGPLPAHRPAPATTRPVYIGTYSSSGGPGLGLAAFDPVTGALTGTGSVAVADPSFLAAGRGSLLYAVDEYENTVTALSTAGGPHVLNSSGTGGSGPCHLAVHAAGGHLMTANYDSGSLAVHALAADGSLGARTDLVQHTGSGPDPDRQAGPHAHMVFNDLAGAFVLAVDLGTDSVYTYRLEAATGTLEAVSRAAFPPGTGPRHGVFHPSGRYLYVADELGDTLTVCAYDAATGRVTPGAALATVPPGAGGGERNYPAEAVVSPDGAFLYVSNRGDDSVARYRLDDGGGTPVLLDAVPSGGAYPRHIALAPGGAWLFAANQNSGTVTVFARDPATGALTATGTSYPATAAVCVLPG